MPDTREQKFDLFIIGGGVNGCGMARDAAGRGYSVALAEKGDLGSATSSASTKLFHGGLRYLEYFEFRLVREALKEREVLLKAMPHISRPMRFVLPFDSGMRFQNSTPTSRLLSLVMPWARGFRPAWIIRLGLFLYDHLGGREILPGTSFVDLRRDPVGTPLKPHLKKAYEYSDCWVDDARLVVLNARDAAERGAIIMPRTKVISAVPKNGLWAVTLEDGESRQRKEVLARVLVNATGPWIMDIIREKMKLESNDRIRLVRGSHIVTKRLFDHDKCYLCQGVDGRVVFAIPFERDFTLIGTTEVDHENVDQNPVCTPEEIAYLFAAVGRYIKTPLGPDDVVWTYSGVRPLYDDGVDNPGETTRDYVLRLDRKAEAPVLNILGGKITTYRRLAEAALHKIDGVLGCQTRSWTDRAALPGGDFPVDGLALLEESLQRQLPFLNERTIYRLVRQYGTEAATIFSDAEKMTDLGVDFGHGVTARELEWGINNEWVQTAEDFLWRRTKLGLYLSEAEADKIAYFIKEFHG